MRRGAIFLVLILMGWPSESMGGPPIGPPPPPPGSIEPPREIGTASLIAGSLGIVAGAGQLAVAPFLGHGPWGTIAVVFGVGGVVAGSVGVYYGARQRAGLRRWQDTVGMNRHQWHRRYQPGRPVSSGVGLATAGAISLGAGIGLGVHGYTSLVWDPGENRYAWQFSFHGTVGMVSGLTMIVMGSIQEHRYHRRRPARDDFDFSAYPWATRTAAGFGVSGRFSL
jgi:hypothetical protein